MLLDDMTLEQLHDINALICERIDELQAQLDCDILVRLHIGSKVSFRSRDNKTVFGTVIKINRKTVVVLGEDKQRFKVPPGLLAIVKPVS